ncbi:DUF2809 domain-containing protein [Pedobacter sp. L105]|uniref:ribosomal maturation YjgA family protein n=1 Tax=Pedobacter sp. L105 TaxID=1641871 RepID=UPI001C205A84|nr:DUF2809 domain-containing protein [Pedobacter sp. L105]
MNSNQHYHQVKSRNWRIRSTYALLVIIVIALGILSRKVAAIPPITGDVLYAVMMFLIIRFLLIRLNYKTVALISLSICYCIELSQLYQAPWINQIRNTTLGGLVLGHGFLWSDMIAYTVGTVICLLAFKFFSRK